MPETDTSSPMKHVPRKTSTEVVRGTCFIKEFEDARALIHISEPTRRNLV